MRILYVCNDFGIAPSGTKGASIHLRSITAALARAGHEVQLLSPKPGPDGQHPARRLLPPGCPAVDGCAKLLKQWMLSRGLGDSAARELRPLLYNAWLADGATDFIGDDPPDVVVERLSLLSHAGVDLAEMLHCPLIVEVNAILSEEAKTFRTLEMQNLARRIERRVLERADAVIAVSAALAGQVVAMGIDAAKVHVVPNGTDPALLDSAPPRAQCRSRLGINGEFVVGFVGSLKLWHGVDVLLEAFRLLHARDNSVRLLVVGSGPMEADLRASAQGMKLAGAVIFTGAVAHERVPALLRAMDVAVAPFKSMATFYFSPLKLFEYMAARVCVVATQLGQIGDVVDDGQTGLLCPPDDAGALAAVLSRLNRSPDLRRELAAKAHDFVCQNYTWDHAAERTLGIIDCVRQQFQATRRADSTCAEPLVGS